MKQISVFTPTIRLFIINNTNSVIKFNAESLYISVALGTGRVFRLDLDQLALVNGRAADPDEGHSLLSGSASLTFLLLLTTRPLLRRGHLETVRFRHANCVANGCLALSHHRVRFWAPSPNVQLAPSYPGLLIPPLPAPERYDLSHHLVVRPRSAHAARC